MKSRHIRAPEDRRAPATSRRTERGVLRWRNRQPLQRGRFNLPADRAGDRRQLALPDLRDHQNRDARRFNGTLVVEWANVALGLECGFVFNEAHEYLRPDATDQFQRGTGTLIHGLPRPAGQVRGLTRQAPRRRTRRPAQKP